MTQPDPADIVTAAALLQAYADGGRNFTTVTLPEANLSQADLKGTDLSYADLSEANLSQANLRGVDLSYANLVAANLQDADLRGAMLIGTNLRTANLAGAKLESADYDPEETHFPAGFDPIVEGLKADR